MTVPQVNVSREDRATMTKNIDAAFNNLNANGNPIALAYTANTWETIGDAPRIPNKYSGMCDLGSVRGSRLCPECDSAPAFAGPILPILLKCSIALGSIPVKTRYGQFNPKRRLRECDPAERVRLGELAAKIRYGGNPEHKKNPGDFGLTPPSDPRPGKSLCDGVGVYSRAEALNLLKKRLSRG